jgi:hypothetical protein
MNKHHLKQIQNKVYRQITGRSKVLDKKRGRYWAKFKTRLYKKPFSLFYDEIIGIQPMTEPIGLVFYLNRPAEIREEK